MPSPANILIYGQDAALLGTRRMLLEKAGYKVFATTRLTGLNPVILNDRLHLLILCHSLSSVQCGRAHAFVQLRWPQAKVLQLTSETFGVSPLLVTESLNAMEGPAKLVARVSQILAGTNDRTTAHSQTGPVGEQDAIQYNGTVKWFNNAEGNGFLGRNASNDPVHYSWLRLDDDESLRDRDPASFNILRSKERIRANQASQVNKKND